MDIEIQVFNCSVRDTIFPLIRSLRQTAKDTLQMSDRVRLCHVETNVLKHRVAHSHILSEICFFLSKVIIFIAISDMIGCMHMYMYLFI